MSRNMLQQERAELLEKLALLKQIELLSHWPSILQKYLKDEQAKLHAALEP